MPIDAIGDLNLRIAETEAQGIEKRAGMKQEREQALATGIGESIKGGLDSAEVLQKQAIDAQMKKEANELLKSGVDGVRTYANELGVDPTLYVNMANMAKSPEELKPIYQLMKKKSDKDAVAKSVNDTMMELKPIFNEAMTTSSPDLIAKARNKSALVAANATTPEAREEAARMVKMLDDASTRTSKATGGTKDIADKLKLSREEAAFFDKRIKEAKIIKDKAAGVRVAVSRAMDNAAAGKDPNNSTLDQVLGVTLQKVLDPPSVVRESEFARLGMTQSFLDMIQGKLKGLSAGGVGLTDESRAVATQFIEDMNEIAERAIRKQMMTSAVRAGFGDRFDLQEIDAQLFSPEEVAKMKDIHEGKSTADDDVLDERIRKNVKLFLDNPDMLSGGKVKSTKGSDVVVEEKTTAVEAPSGKPNRRVATSIEEF